MTVHLRPDQEAWLEARVERGEYSSIEDAVQQMLDARMLDEGEGLAWAKPYVDDALEAVGRGELLTLEEHKAHTAALLRKLEVNGPR